MRYVFPADYDTAPCYLVPINGALIPLVAGALKHFEERRSWNSDEEYEIAYNAFLALEAQMTNCTMQALLDSNDRLYRLLDSAMYGRVYQLVSADPLSITPAIPAVPNTTVEAPGLLGMVNALPGVLDVGWFGIGGHKATLADVVKALRVGSDSTANNLVSQLEGILGAGSDIANIGELVTGLFTGSVSALEEGGIMVLLAGAIVGNLAATGALSSQLTTLGLQLARISHSIDGGGLLPPADNILEALRGDTVASADRNVIDSMAAGSEAAIVEILNRLYRMLDTALYGREYVLVSADPEEVVEPPINATHLLVIEDDASILGRMERLKQLLENALNGTETPVYDRANGVRDLLEQLIAAIPESGQFDEEMLAQLEAIAGLLQ